jgi:DNA-binding beta-propeller fold protein YncE
MGGEGGSGGAGGAGGSMMAMGINPAAQDVQNPYDATPDPDNNFIYFTAADPITGAGVYKVAAAGGASSPVVQGDPFVAPFGIAMNAAGTQLYVADSSAQSGPADAEDAGLIFVVSPTGGAPVPLMGSEGFRPRGLEVATEGVGDMVYFTGKDSLGNAGVFSIPAAGGSVTPIVAGTPFVSPSGIAVAANGDIYVADAVTLSSSTATVYKIAKGANNATELFTGIAVGYPAGIALDEKDETLLISGLSQATLTDVVVLLNLAAMTTTLYTGDATVDISKFEESAGLHRAKKANSFAWADSRGKQDPNQKAAGTVFAISF